MPGARNSTTTVAPLRRELRTFNIEALVDAVRVGALRIPSFQRNFLWSPDEALTLLDSINRGWPIGALLLWRRPATSEHLVHGSVVVDVPARHDALWVIDGQQRLIALARILAGKGRPDEPLAMVYDLETRRFKHLPPTAPPRLLDLPLETLLDPYWLDAWLGSRYGAESEHDEHARQLATRIREFLVPAHILDTDDEDAVRQIYVRSNTHRRPLATDDIFSAIHRHEGRAPTDLAELARALAELAFGTLKEDELVCMRHALHGDEEDAPAPHMDVPTALVDLERSARATITFLRSDAGIPHVSLLPYHLPLRILARFFYLHPEPHPRSRDLLARWLWRGALTEAHIPGSSATRDLLALVDDDEHATVQRLLQTCPRGHAPMLSLTGPWGTRSRHNILCLVLLSLDPRDLETGIRVAPGPQELDDAHVYDRLLRSIFPEQRQAGPANLIFHRRSPDDIATAILACEDLGYLATHAIPPEAQLALRSGRSDTFLALRAARLSYHLADFIDRRAEWDEPDTPPVEALHLRTHD